MMKVLLKGQTLLALMISLSLSSLLLLSISHFYVQIQTQNQHMLLHLKLQAELQRTLQLIGKRSSPIRISSIKCKTDGKQFIFI